MEYTGLAPDERSVESQNKDISVSAVDVAFLQEAYAVGSISENRSNRWFRVAETFSEIVGWIEEFMSYRNQDQTSTCVAQSIAGIFQWLIYKLTGETI